eukprot:423709-Pleurochrysis_carterae.AAC.1
MHGSRRRRPAASGASSTARVPAKRQSVPVEAHNCPTDRRESLMDGTQRKPVMVRDMGDPRSSRAVTFMSPTATQR